MTDTPAHHKPGFLTEEPEHCFACFHLTQPGQGIRPDIRMTGLVS